MSKPNRPARVKDVTEYWAKPPPESSATLTYWLAQIEAGWKPNSRVRTMNYHDAAEFFGVFIWEYLTVLSPLLHSPQELD